MDFVLGTVTLLALATAVAMGRRHLASRAGRTPAFRRPAGRTRRRAAAAPGNVQGPAFGRAAIGCGASGHEIDDSRSG